MSLSSVVRPSSALRASAEHFIGTSGQLVAWEAASLQRTIDSVRLFAEGRLDAATLRAMLGASADRSQIPAPKGTAVLPLIGPLSPDASLFTLLGLGTSLRAFAAQLREAATNKAVASIVVLTDSPGGYVGMVPETAALVRQVAATKPVVAAVSGLNCSAAYWITSGCTAIEATPSGLIGSIGVFTMRVSLARQLDREGVDVEQIGAGRFKGEGNPLLPLTDAERSATQARVDETYAEFVGDVAAGRKVSGHTIRNGYGEGRAISAKQAHALGMIDGVALIEDTVSRVVQGRGAMAFRTADEAALQEENVQRWRLGLLPRAVAPHRTAALSKEEETDWAARLRLL